MPEPRSNAARLLASWLICAAACGDDERAPRDVIDAADTTDAVDVIDAADTTDAVDTADATDATDEVDSFVVTWDRARDPWPMFGGDPQRTQRSPFVGPTSLPAGGTSWHYDAAGGAAINMQPTVDARGVAFGTWGLLRGAATTDATTSDKSDGRYYSLDRDGHERFAPLEPAALPACYARAGASSATDVQWCGAGLHVSYYNGTIEGTGLVDPARAVHYVGRGDGRLYAIDLDTGRVRWSFATFDPGAPDHPDGGGEVVGGATMTPTGLIVFATFGLPWPGTAEQPARETQAVYAVDREGALAWRYPPDRASLDNPITAAVALSPDGATVYAGTWLSDTSVPGRLVALDARTGTPRWDLALTHAAHASRLWVRQLAVAADGTVLLAGTESRPFGLAAAVGAVVDQGQSARLAWVAEPHGWPDAKTTVTQGLALGDGVVFAATADARDLNGKEGLLAALDPATGALLGTFDPGDDAPGSMTGPLVDAAGHVYVGTRGRHDLVAAPWAAGSQWHRGVMHALAWHPAAAARFEVLWSTPLDALLDWATPALDADGTLYFGSSAPLPFKFLADVWEPLTGTPPRTTPSLYAIAATLGSR